MAGISAGISAFREGAMTSDTIDAGLSDFNSFESRRIRYQVLWSYFESTAYRDIHKWASLMRADYGLYQWTRNIYNPSSRLAEFWRSHLLAGALDPNAGDGISVPSALPIITDNERLRPAIAALWRASNWQANKDILGLWGTVLGDVVIRINDDQAKKKVYLTITHPGTIKELTRDTWGNIKGYVIEENWPDPNESSRTVVYREIAYRDGINVVYDLYLDNKPYNIHQYANGKFNNWWTVPYGFIPMVAIKHNDVGLDYGFSELFPALQKIREADDLTSKLDDQIRKLTDPVWILAGVKPPTQDDPKSKRTSTSSGGEEGRQELDVFYGEVGADAKALVADLNIEQVSNHIDKILKDLERDYPELTVNINTATNDISGKALRIHRQPVEDKVLQRRPGYDDAIVKAQQMAIAIGGWRRYPGYEGFGLNSYAHGDLDHTIGDRPVFRRDETDDIEIQTEFWKAAKAATDAGVPLEVFLEDNGWDAEKITRLQGSPEYQAKLSGYKTAARLAEGMGDPNVPPTTPPAQQSDPITTQA
jgi:hypothetical protein